MGVKAAGANLFLKGGFLNRTNYIGALRDATNEFTDAWYRRVAMALADWTRTNDGSAVNAAALNFPPPNPAAANAPGFMGMWTLANGGTLLATQAFTGSPGMPGVGANFGWDAGDLEIEVAMTGAVTGRGLRRGFESGIVSGTTYLGLFERDPSEANPGPIDTREAVGAAQWVATPGTPGEVQNNANISFGVQNFDPPRPVWCGLFDAAVAGNLLWYDQLDVTALDPELGSTITVLARKIGIGIVVDA